MPNNHFAVLDLGSNSFHMIVALIDQNNNLQILDKLKDRSRLAAGLDSQKNLTYEAQEKALSYFKQYAERLKDFENGCVRCVATDTFRKAKNGQSFLEVAEDTLGWPIEIISGIEEARLIYKGVSHDYPSQRRRLVIDIGGGSTELIIGTGPTPLELVSSKMGCVSWQQKYFPHNKYTPENFQSAIDGARQVLSSYVRRYRDMGWQEAIGTSGTIRAIGDIMVETNRSDSSITKQNLNWLVEELTNCQSIENIPWHCVSESRREVLAGGVSILLGVMEALRIQKLKPVNSALREGVLVEMVGRLFGEDIREQTVQSMARRFSLQEQQRSQVEKTALQFFHSVQDEWRMNDEDENILRWAAQLHEIGLSIAFRSYHKHGGYIIKNADMAGFSTPQQAELALLIHTHRGKIKLQELEEQFLTLDERLRRLIAIIRISTRLHRRRSPKPQPFIPLNADGNHLQMLLPVDYLLSKPLTAADLHIEINELAKLGIHLEL